MRLINAEKFEAVSYVDTEGRENTFDDGVMWMLEQIDKAPTVEPCESFEWCTDCKEYDQEKHCCPRWTKVIRQTVDELTKDGYAPVRHGKWLLQWETEDTRMLRCSECKMVFNVGKGRDGNYCPNCGAKMGEVDE